MTRGGKPRVDVSRLRSGAGRRGAVDTSVPSVAFSGSVVHPDPLTTALPFVTSLCAGSSSMWLVVQRPKGTAGTRPLSPPLGTQSRGCPGTSPTVEEVEGELFGLTRRGTHRCPRRAREAGLRPVTPRLCEGAGSLVQGHVRDTTCRAWCNVGDGGIPLAYARDGGETGAHDPRHRPGDGDDGVGRRSQGG